MKRASLKKKKVGIRLEKPFFFFLHELRIFKVIVSGGLRGKIDVRCRLTVKH